MLTVEFLACRYFGSFQQCRCPPLSVLHGLIAREHINASAASESYTSRIIMSLRGARFNSSLRKTLNSSGVLKFNIPPSSVLSHMIHI
jgi:hypothetical protein